MDKYLYELKKKEPYDIKRYHPEEIIMAIILSFSVIMAILLCAAPWLSNELTIIQDWYIPSEFSWAIVFLSLSCLFCAAISDMYRNENFRMMRNYLATVILLGSIGLGCELSGLKSIYQHENILAESLAYQVLIIRFAIIQQVAVLSGLLFYFYKCNHAHLHPVSALIFTTSLLHRMRIRLIIHVWFYQVVLWICLFLYFILSIYFF